MCVCVCVYGPINVSRNHSVIYESVTHVIRNSSLICTGNGELSVVRRAERKWSGGPGFTLLLCSAWILPSQATTETQTVTGSL